MEWQFNFKGVRVMLLCFCKSVHRLGTTFSGPFCCWNPVVGKKEEIGIQNWGYYFWMGWKFSVIYVMYGCLGAGVMSLLFCTFRTSSKRAATSTVLRIYLVTLSSRKILQIKQMAAAVKMCPANPKKTKRHQSKRSQGKKINIKPTLILVFHS